MNDNDMFVTKRSGMREIYDREKAIMSVCDAWEAVYDEKPDYLVIDIMNKVELQLEELYDSGAAIDTDTINDLIEKEIESRSLYDMARAYGCYRYNKPMQQ